MKLPLPGALRDWLTCFFCSSRLFCSFVVFRRNFVLRGEAPPIVLNCFGLICFDLFWFDSFRFDSIWFDSICFDLFCFGLTWFASFDLIRLIRFDWIRLDLICFDLLDLIWFVWFVWCVWFDSMLSPPSPTLSNYRFHWFHWFPCRISTSVRVQTSSSVLIETGVLSERRKNNPPLASLSMCGEKKT